MNLTAGHDLIPGEKHFRWRAGEITRLEAFTDAVFGFAVTWIAVFEGYDAPPTAEGVSRATTRTVVTSSLAVLALDFVLTALMFTGGGHAQ